MNYDYEEPWILKFVILDGGNFSERISSIKY